MCGENTGNGGINSGKAYNTIDKFHIFWSNQPRK